MQVAAMEAFQQLAIESFSYRWLLNIRNASFDALEYSFRSSIDTQEGLSFIEMEPKWPSPQRLVGNTQDFDFALPSSHPPVLVHADEIFSNGLLLPLHMITPPRTESTHSPEDTPVNRPVSLNPPPPPLFRAVQSRPLSFGSSKEEISRKTSLKLLSFGSCGRYSKKIIRKLLCLLVPVHKREKGLSLNRPPFSKKMMSSRISCTESPETSPRASDAFLSMDDWRQAKRSFDMGIEKSIDEAVLHCKKSATVSTLFEENQM